MGDERERGGGMERLGESRRGERKGEQRGRRRGKEGMRGERKEEQVGRRRERPWEDRRGERKGGKGGGFKAISEELTPLSTLLLPCLQAVTMTPRRLGHANGLLRLQEGPRLQYFRLE